MRVFIPLNIFILSLFFALPATAQDCDCDDSDNCPYSFGPNFTGQICYDITDAFNNDLADPSQGVCGVAITFTHQHIWDLELTLISPAGQEVPLVGYNMNFFGTTNNVIWNILFIPCANVPSPDTINNVPFSAEWINNQNWPFAALFDGSYHPVGGNCLESFNTGPVNGTWCLQIDNQPSPYSGEILNFEVILCDNSGLLCCDADAGVLEIDDFTICQGDSSLLIDWEADYGPIFPNPGEYGYLFVVSDTAGIILQIDTMPSLMGYTPGEYAVCGLSYLLADSLLLPVPDGVLSIDSLASNLSSGAPWFCGDLTEDCVAITIVPPPTPIFLTDTLCAGEAYTVGDSTVTEPGQYLFQIENAFGCDSLVSLDLTVLQPDSTFLVDTVCFGESYQVGDSLFTFSGSYEVVLANAFGCDSLVFLDLTVLDEIATFLTDTLCQGELYAVGDSLFGTPGSYEVLLVSELGCDSTVFLDLTVLDPIAQIAIPDTITCSATAVWLDGSASSSGAGVSYFWTALTGELSAPLDSNQVLATEPGIYELEVGIFFCSARDTVEVTADTLPPVASVFPADTLTCAVDSVQLDGSGSSAGSGIAYQWLDPSGGLLPDSDTTAIWVAGAGSYSLIVSNAENGCADTVQVVVVDDLVSPLAEAGPASTLNCLDTVVLLDGSATYQDGPFAFEWLGPAGDPVPWTDSLQAEVSDPGLYVLWATNLLNACSASDSVLIALDTIVPLADAGQPDTLNCYDPLLSLNGMGLSNSGTVAYFWETNGGNILGDPTQPDPEVDAPGLYVLTVTDPVNFCAATDSVAIFQDVAYPMADAGPTVTLNCLLKEWTLGNPDSTSLGTSFSYTWVGPQGDTIATELSPTIQEGGTYHLFVTNMENGCTSTDSVFIEQEGDIPNAVIDGGGAISCSNPEILLDGSASSSGFSIEYSWLDQQGNVIGNGNQLTVGNAGVYCLVVEDGLNFCRDTACVEVFQGPGFPLVDAGPNETLDCLTGQAFPQGTVAPLDPNFALTWTTSTGNIVSGPNQLAIIVDEPGWYVFTVDDTLNDCVVVDSALVVLDTAACLPLVNAGADGWINCYHLPLLYDTLDASQGTSSGPDIAYEWTAIGGTVILGENTLFPVVTEGTFILTVTNTLLNLSATDTVVVYEDLAFPIANAGLNDTIDCSTINADYYLDGSGSSQGSPYIYEWSTLGGFIVSGADSLFALINAPGLYDLQVTDTLNGCISTDAVEIALDGDLPTPCLETSIQIPCGLSSVVVGDTCSAGAPYTYLWTVTGGSFPGDPTLATVEVAWEDTVVWVNGLIIDTTNQCPLGVAIELFSPVNCFPECEIAVPEALTCDITSITLDASGSSSGPDFAYSWSAISGSLCGGETTPFPCVDAPGVYRLTVTDTTNQFTCTEDVIVLADTLPPIVDAGLSGFLTCDSGEALLQAVEDPDLSYQWTAAGGPSCLVAGDLTPSPLVSCPGTYYLEVTSALNGCSATDSTQVLFDTIPPIATLQINDMLTCATTSVQITSQGSTLGPDITYQWSLNNAPLATGLGVWTATQPGLYCLTVIDEQTGCASQACDTLMQILDPPPADAGEDGVLTCGVTSLTLTGNPGPAVGLAVEWTSPDGCIQGDPLSQNIQADCSGVYIYTVTDQATGCWQSDTLWVSDQTTPPEALIQPADPITCQEPQVVLDGSASLPAGNLAFFWSTNDGVLNGPQDAETALAAAEGTYQLIVQDLDTECTDTAVVFIVSESVIPAANAGPDTLLNCFFPEIQLDGSASAAGMAYVYSWAPVPASGGGTLFPTVDQPGMYVLTVLDTTNACWASDTVWVGADFLPPQAVIDLSAAPVITCLQASVDLSGAASLPIGGLTYMWSTPDGQFLGDPEGEAVVVVAEGVYQLVVQHVQNGCLDSTVVQVAENVAPPQITWEVPDTLTCAQDSVLLDASGTTASGPLAVLWTGPGPVQDSATLTPTVFQPGLYQVVVSDLENGCVAEDSIWVAQDTVSPLAQASALGVFDCQTAAVALSAAGSSTGPGILYTWSGPPGASISDINALQPSVNEPGWYYLAVLDQGNGCANSDSVEAISEGFPILGMGLNLTLPSCYGDPDGVISVDTVFGGQGPFTFAFADNGFYPYTTFRYLAAGEYSIIVEDDNGCRYDTLIYLDNPNQIAVDLGPDQYIQLGQSVAIEAIPNVPLSDLVLIDWYPSGDPACPACLAFETQPDYTTTFVILIQDEQGCTATDQMTIFVEKVSNLFLPNVFSPNGDGENDYFFPQSGQEVVQVDQLQIFDRWGNLVFQADSFLPNDPTFGWDGRFRGKPMDPQVFVWQCRILLRDGQVETYKGDVFLVR